MSVSELDVSIEAFVPRDVMQKILFVHYKNILKKLVGAEFENLISIELPKNEAFGDFSTNIAMVLAKKLGKAPIEIAKDFCKKLEQDESFKKVEVKGPGFINWWIPRLVLFDHFPSILEKDFGKVNIGNGTRMNIEYVSANPTGPLHAGHARGAVSGDVLSNLLSFVGYDVTKEYYINDAGKQIEQLAKSLRHRYLELFGKNSDEDFAYPGEYIIDTAKKLAEKYGDSFINKEEREWMPFFKEFAVADMMENIRSDLKQLGIKHDVFTSELKIVQSGAVERVVDLLHSKGLIYKGVLDVPKGKEPEDWEAREQLLFKSTQFGDEVDRPLQKSDGSWTYFATDIAYHADKISRGFDEMIDFWGADHGGYIKRMQAAVSAISDGRKNLDVKISQIVRFIDNGKEVKMSKRAGTFITVKDVIDSVGKDVIRFIMLTRRDDAPLDFDFKQVVDQSRDNPVFYVQYAYARTHSVIRQFSQSFPGEEIPDVSKVDLTLLDNEDVKIIKVLCDWPRQAVMAAKNKEPHRLAFYLADVAAAFHRLWNQGKDNADLRFVSKDDFPRTCARMLMLKAIQNVIEIVFDLMGVTPLKELR